MNRPNMMYCTIVVSFDRWSLLKGDSLMCIDVCTHVYLQKPS